jgi:quinol monooxygenase YgiN
MLSVGLWVRLEAKPGREADVAEFLKQGQALVDQEPDTIAWFAIQLGPTTFGIFDAFSDERGRDSHLAGEVASALAVRAEELFAEAPGIRRVDVLASKLP